MKRFKGVLIIDDDPISNYMTREFFSRMGNYDYISFCRNGKEALRFLKKNKDNLPELILLELHLPFMNGSELLEKLSEDGFDSNKTKIVLYTINSKEISAEREKYGLELIDKPLTREKFYEAIRIQNRMN
jgi:two-component system, CitB family, response regulator MalR